MSVSLMSPEAAAVLTHASFALAGAGAVVAIFLVTAVALSTAIHLHKSREAIARLRFGEIDVRKPK